MKHFSYYIATLLSAIVATLLACKTSNSNEFTIYVSRNNPGWHIVDLRYDSVHKNLNKISVMFDNRRTFRTATIRSLNLRDYRITFLYPDGDTAKSELWFKGEYHFDSLQRIFVHFYVPTEVQQKTINDYLNAPIYDSLRTDVENIIYSYLEKLGDIK